MPPPAGGCPQSFFNYEFADPPVPPPGGCPSAFFNYSFPYDSSGSDARVWEAREVESKVKTGVQLFGLTHEDADSCAGGATAPAAAKPAAAAAAPTGPVLKDPAAALPEGARDCLVVRKLLELGLEYRCAAAVGADSGAAAAGGGAAALVVLVLVCGWWC